MRFRFDLTGIARPEPVARRGNACGLGNVPLTPLWVKRGQFFTKEEA
jgi:hypothetical protein